jgi:hypothetical protein
VLIVAIVGTAAEVAILFGICTPIGAALGPPATKTPLFRDFSAGEAAAWGLTWGLAAAVAFVVGLPSGFLE